MRLYVPATLDDLDAAAVTSAAATWTVPARAAHAVTPALVAALPDEDDEGLEWHAFLAAAHDSLLLIAGRPGAVPLRVVVTVEVPDAVVAPGGVPDEGAAGDDAATSEVAVTADVPGVRIVAVHVDEPAARTDVDAVLTAAANETPAGEAELGDAIQRVTDRDLLWYDPTELLAIPRT